MLFRVTFIDVYRCFACVHALICVPGACGGLERPPDALELQLEAVTSRHVGAGN